MELYELKQGVSTHQRNYILVGESLDLSRKINRLEEYDKQTFRTRFLARSKSSTSDSKTH